MQVWAGVKLICSHNASRALSQVATQVAGQLLVQVWAGVKHVCSQNASSALSQIATQPAGAGVGGRVPTWRIVPGSSTESLALDVALQCGVPLPVVQRAAELWKVGQHDLGGSVLPDPGVDTCGPWQLCSGQLSGVGMHSVGA